MKLNFFGMTSFIYLPQEKQNKQNQKQTNKKTSAIFFSSLINICSTAYSSYLEFFWSEVQWLASRISQFSTLYLEKLKIFQKERKEITQCVDFYLIHR